MKELPAVMADFQQWLNEVCYMLSQYSGRDKVIRTCCYAAKFASAITVSSNPDLAKKLGIFGSKMSQTRATLRLFDDLPMLQASLSYGLGRNEPDKITSFVGVLTNVIDHLYYPIDKMCWLIEHRLLNVQNPTVWDTLSSLFWLISIYLNMIRTLKVVSITEKHMKCCLKDKVEKPDPAALAKLMEKHRLDKIAIGRYCLDLVHAGSTLPLGMLWGGRLRPWQVGLVGTVSSLLGMYLFLAKKRLSKS